MHTMIGHTRFTCRNMQFSEQDVRDLQEREISPAGLIDIIYRFTHQTDSVFLERPCIPGDGILTLSTTEALRYSDHFDLESRKRTIIKFVPASGAATRMFSHLYQYDPNMDNPLIEEFIFNLDLFAFYPVLQRRLSESGKDLKKMMEANDWSSVFQFILSESGLNYGKFPKGLIPFHKYQDGSIRTAFEEHMHESADYGREADGTCRIHFTLAPHQIDLVMHFLREKAKDFPYENFVLEHSLQRRSTDTPAIDRNNIPVRGKDGKMIFRPAGHGALIHNLQELDEDIIFIKNIDNVTTADQKTDSAFYKKVIAGLLLQLKAKADAYIEALEANDRSVLPEALDFIQKWFQPGVPLGIQEDNLMTYVRMRLDRPMRVCGMVKNEGEPGGGPFWVRMSDGYVSKQIVEKSQIDHHNIAQMKVLSSSTHFNPVDIVCSIKNRRGEKYHLDHFIDHSTGFISEKFSEGQVIKALELPGLWNGSMALWNTVFVEVPVSTFHPVKTVNDLLRPGHQSA